MPLLASSVLFFAATALVIVAAGTVLARSGDIIAARTNLGGVWVGSVFLAFATSLPELTTDIAAVRFGAPDLAAGDLFGSSMANMLILALLNLTPYGTALFRKAALEHVVYAAIAIMLTAMAAMIILLRPTATLVGIGPGSIVLLLAYLVGSRAVYRQSALARQAKATAEMSGQVAAVGEAEAAPAEVHSLRRALLTFAGGAIAILVAAPFFARSAQQIAEITGLGSTFVGTWLLGFSTSLPELVTSLAALRIGAFDLAVGNLFGSNAFNMTVFPVLDAVQPGPPVLGVVSPVHAISAFMAIVLMSIGVAALMYRAQKRLALLEPSSALMIIGYFAGLALLLSQTAG